MNPVKDIEILGRLGEGAYGCVHKGRLVKTNTIVAVKTIRIGSDDEGVSSTTLREITILQNMDHQNIVK
jgi:serine/threonine protein kinase